MRHPRIYYPHTVWKGQLVKLETSISSRLCRVLRMRKGMQVTLFDGQGHEASAFLCQPDPRKAAVMIETVQEISRESCLALTLASGLCKRKRMDYLLQKSVEIGVSRIVLLQLERNAPSNDKIQQRLRHFHQVVISAAEQSGRTILPQLEAPVALPEFLMENSTALKLFLDPDGSTVLSRLAAQQTKNKPHAITIFTGPEGGMSAQEIKRISASGAHTVRLGQRILRAETAPLAALSCCQLLWGDFSDKSHSGMSISGQPYL